MSSVLVTGAAGFIGRHLVPCLRREGHEVIEVRRDRGDVSDAGLWRDLPTCDVVIHLAAKSSVPASWDAPGAFLSTNLTGTIQALEYGRARGAALIFPSSYMYGAGGDRPIGEDSAVAVRNPYALSKRLAEEACQFFAAAFGIDITVFRLFNVFGPGQSADFLIPMIVEQVRAGDAIRVNDLEPRRDYVYVQDVVEAIATAVPSGSGFRLFNLGSGESHSVAEVIETVQDVWGTRLPVESAGRRRPDEIMNTIADISRAAAQLNWRPRFTLRQGLEAMSVAS